MGNIKDMDARSFWELVNVAQDDRFRLIIEEMDYFQVWQDQETGKYYCVDVEEFNDFDELELVATLEYDTEKTHTRPEGRLALALESDVCGDVNVDNGKGRYMWFIRKKKVA